MNMRKSTQSEAAQSSRNACLDTSMMFWKDWNKIMPSNVFHGSVPPWFSSSGKPLADQSPIMKDSLQKVTQYLEFNARQQKTLLDWSNIWMDYLTALARNHRENATNGGDRVKAVTGALDASKELMKSFVSLIDGQMENIIRHV
jgi:hypothetical protein